MGCPRVKKKLDITENRISTLTEKTFVTNIESRSGAINYGCFRHEGWNFINSLLAASSTKANKIQRLSKGSRRQ